MRKKLIQSKKGDLPDMLVFLVTITILTIEIGRAHV